MSEYEIVQILQQISRVLVPKMDWVRFCNKYQREVWSPTI